MSRYARQLPVAGSCRLACWLELARAGRCTGSCRLRRGRRRWQKMHWVLLSGGTWDRTGNLAFPIRPLYWPPYPWASLARPHLLFLSIIQRLGRIGLGVLERQPFSGRKPFAEISAHQSGPSLNVGGLRASQSLLWLVVGLTNRFRLNHFVLAPTPAPSPSSWKQTPTPPSSLAPLRNRKYRECLQTIYPHSVI